MYCADMMIYDDISTIKGVGSKTLALLNKLGIFTVGDMLNFIPRSYKSIGNIKNINTLIDGEEACLSLKTISAKIIPIKGKGKAVRAVFADETAQIVAYFFNQPYILSVISKPQNHIIYGKVKIFNGRLQLDSPMIINADMVGSVFVYYRLTAGITQNKMRSIALECVKHCTDHEEYSNEFLSKYSLICLQNAYTAVHSPINMEQQKQGLHSLIFRELLVFNRALELLDVRSNAKAPKISSDALYDEFSMLLGYKPTNAQIRAMSDITHDMQSGYAMNRLLQGDVGSGKTAVIMYAAYCALKSGYKTAVMAPTEILATQHYHTAVKLFGEDKVCLLTGSQTKAERREALNSIFNADVIIGTHALISSDLVLPNIGLIVTDEQHKFGVKQRFRLSGGTAVHTLTVTATPIPRTLSIALYGDLDISVIDELPPGRKPIKTYIVSKNKRMDMYNYIAKKASEGQKTYVVCPLIEESENIDAISAEEAFTNFKKLNVKCGLLHGKLKSEEKKNLINSFITGDIQVLVSTTVVEVGVDVPDATIMAIENAERFGLAQLHQLRGRVGRGSESAECFLVNGSDCASERLDVLKNSTDGFYIAEKDLEFRGPGNMAGVSQHGTGSLKISNIVRDSATLLFAKKALKEIAHAPKYSEDHALVTKLAYKFIKNDMIEITLN